MRSRTSQHSERPQAFHSIRPTVSVSIGVANYPKDVRDMRELLSIDGAEVELTAREWLLLECLVRHTGKVVSKERVQQAMSALESSRLLLIVGSSALGGEPDEAGDPGIGERVTARRRIDVRDIDARRPDVTCWTGHDESTSDDRWTNYRFRASLICSLMRAISRSQM